MKISFPWPPKMLNPNARPHWSVKALATRKYRFEARLLTQSQPVELLKSVDGKLLVSLLFMPPNKHARDLDNCLANFKAGLDGIADALDVNDKRFKITMEMGDPVKYGAVQVTI